MATLVNTVILSGTEADTTGTSAYAEIALAKAALGSPTDTTGTSAYAQLALAKAALVDETNTDVAAVVAAQETVDDRNDDVVAAINTLAEAVAASTSTITVEDVATAVAARNTAQDAVNTAQKVLDDANDELPEGLAAAQTALAAAQTAYDKAKMDLQEIGAQTLGDDEILIANDEDLEGTIGAVDIRNMTTMLRTTAVADITDGDALSISIGSASGIVGATSVGSMESREGMVIGGDDNDLEDNEILVYVV